MTGSATGGGDLAALHPLGLLAPSSRGAAWPPAALATSVGTMPDHVRPLVAGYLGAAEVFIPWMEITDDVLGNRFTVAGGSGLASDGVWFWRVDAADLLPRGVPARLRRPRRPRDVTPASPGAAASPPGTRVRP